MIPKTDNDFVKDVLGMQTSPPLRNFPSKMDSFHTLPFPAVEFPVSAFPWSVNDGEAERRRLETLMGLADLIERFDWGKTLEAGSG